MSELSAKERRFVAEYLKDQNGTQAAIRSGYSKRSAKELGHRLLTKVHIRMAIEKKLRDLEEKASVSAERVLKELGRLAFVDPKDFYEADGTTLRKLSDMPEDARRAIASVDAEEIFEGVGRDRINVGDLKKLRLASKLGALELLGKYHKMFTDKVEVKVTDSLADRIKRARQRAVNK